MTDRADPDQTSLPLEEDHRERIRRALEDFGRRHKAARRGRQLLENLERLARPDAHKAPKVPGDETA